MNIIPRFDNKQVAILKEFLDTPERSGNSMSYCQAAGFLFVVACAPELVQPSAWLPAIIDPDNATEVSIESKQAIVEGLMSLYNESTRQVKELDVRLLPGCEFRDEPMANLEPDASMNQWAEGFKLGYTWLEEMWMNYTPDEISTELGFQMMVLSFFSSREVANAFLNEVQDNDLTLEIMADNMQEIFPEAMFGFARLGNSIQQVVLNRTEASPVPHVGGEKIGRNEPCSCGSGKKYKKCCGVN